MEVVTGHGKEFGFYSKCTENIWKVLKEEWQALVYILNFKMIPLEAIWRMNYNKAYMEVKWNIPRQRGW
jgi:hypothetical protein